jgi:feruloyl esterase
MPQPDWRRLVASKNNEWTAEDQGETTMQPMRTTAIVALAILFAAGTPHTGLALPPCAAGPLNALHVTGMTVTEATPVAATATAPALCSVHGTVVTHGEGIANGLATFAMQLPEIWQQRFFSMGVGGNAGRLRPAVNATDFASAPHKGYVTIVTDTGHTGNGTDASWVLGADGKRDTVKVADFFYRAEHNVTVGGKLFAQAYYGTPVQHAYFDGCSTGGRMAMMEAERYPSDYDGIIAGDPNMDYNAGLQRFVVQKVALATPAAYIPQSLLVAIDKQVTARCDAIDGATDGLVQNPASCPVHAEDLQCHGTDAADCLTQEQSRVLQAYTTPLLDRYGHLLFTGWPITNLSGPRGIGYWTIGDAPPDLANPEQPWAGNPGAAPRGWVFARQSLTYWLGLGPDQKMAALDVDPGTHTVGDKLVAMTESALGSAETKNPAKLLPFLRHGGKLIMYHGASDPALPASRSILFYRQLAARLHGVDKAAAAVRLFLVPGMQHCSGGIGPDQFDTLSAIEAWVEHHKAPDVIEASTKPDAAVPHHLPLCPFPQQALYSGHGEMNDAGNWSCAPPAPDTASTARSGRAG